MQQIEEVKLAVSSALLERLLAEGRLNISDFRCLDQRAKQRIKRIFLNNLRVEMAARRATWPERSRP